MSGLGHKAPCGCSVVHPAVSAHLVERVSVSAVVVSVFVLAVFVTAAQKGAVISMLLFTAPHDHELHTRFWLGQMTCLSHTRAHAAGILLHDDTKQVCLLHVASNIRLAPKCKQHTGAHRCRCITCCLPQAPKPQLCLYCVHKASAVLRSTGYAAPCSGWQCTTAHAGSHHHSRTAAAAAGTQDPQSAGQGQAANVSPRSVCASLQTYLQTRIPLPCPSISNAVEVAR